MPSSKLESESDEPFCDLELSEISPSLSELSVSTGIKYGAFAVNVRIIM